MHSASDFSYIANTHSENYGFKNHISTSFFVTFFYDWKFQLNLMIKIHGDRLLIFKRN